MDVVALEWISSGGLVDESEDEALRELRCPVCDAVWAICDEDGFSELSEEPCEHLRFVWQLENGYEQIGDWDDAAFRDALLCAYQEEEGDDDFSFEDIEVRDSIFESVEAECDVNCVGTVVEVATCGESAVAAYYGYSE